MAKHDPISSINALSVCVCVCGHSAALTCKLLFLYHSHSILSSTLPLGNFSTPVCIFTSREKFRYVQVFPTYSWLCVWSTFCSLFSWLASCHTGMAWLDCAYAFMWSLFAHCLSHIIYMDRCKIVIATNNQKLIWKLYYFVSCNISFSKSLSSIIFHGVFVLMIKPTECILSGFVLFSPVALSGHCCIIHEIQFLASFYFRNNIIFLSHICVVCSDQVWQKHALGFLLPAKQL